MLSQMPARLFAEWMAFFGLEPFGYEVDMTGHAITASVIANTNRKKGKKPYRPSDFVPRTNERVEGREVFGALKSWALMQGAETKKRGN